MSCFPGVERTERCLLMDVLPVLNTLINPELEGAQATLVAKIVDCKIGGKNFGAANERIVNIPDEMLPSC